MSFTNEWTESVPTNENYGYEIDDYLRQFCLNVRERMAVQHKAYASETGHTDTGEHKPGECNVVAVSAKASFPTPASSNAGCLAIATDEGNQWYSWSGSAWTKVQQPVLLTGNQTVAGDKTFSGSTIFSGAVNMQAISTLKDGSVMSTSAAPTEDAMISNKKYVDDAIDATVGAGTMSPLAYSSEQESITFPNGLIIKKGLAVYAGSDLTVTFGTAFPTACEHVQLTIKRTSWNTQYAPLVLGTPAKASFVLSNGTASGVSIYWLAIGR